MSGEKSDVLASAPGSLRPGACPRVAIVTPVYNGERYLAEALESVQQSDYPNLVHVILDNASTDRTPEIIRSFERRRVPLAVFRNPATLPMGDNFNKAVSLVPEDVKYFRVLCADDLMAETAISKMVAVAEQDDQIGVVACQFRHVELFGTELPRDRTIFNGLDMVRSYMRGETRVFCGAHLLFRRSSIREGQPFFDASLSCDDTDAGLRESLPGKFGFVHEELAFFRIHPDSHSAEVHHEGRSLYEWFVLLDRYGSRVLPAEEYKRDRRTHLRRYLRRALLQSIRQGNGDFYRSQVRRLAALGEIPKTRHLADALLDWAKKVVSGKRGRVIREKPQV